MTKAAIKEIETKPVEELTITVPLGEFPENGYISPRLDLHLSPQQARTLKRIAAGLDKAGERLKSGTRVVSGADAIRFLLESE